MKFKEDNGVSLPISKCIKSKGEDEIYSLGGKKEASIRDGYGAG